jgi:hypothetical protein
LNYSVSMEQHLFELTNILVVIVVAIYQNSLGVNMEHSYWREVRHSSKSCLSF